MKYESVGESKSLLRILRVKFLYERMIQEKTGRPRFFTVENSKTGGAHYRKFQRIADWCGKKGVKVEEYLGVLFTHPPRMAQKWPYPYLGFIASDIAFEIFVSRKRMLQRAFQQKDVRDVVKAMSPLNFNRVFTNCFYNGFMVLRSAVERESLRKVEQIAFLFPFFHAFFDVFTPEFIVTHSRFPEFCDVEDSDVREVKVSLLAAVGRVWKRWGKEQKYRDALLTARKNVSEIEKGSVKRVYGHLGNWERVWELMI